MTPAKHVVTDMHTRKSSPCAGEGPHLVVAMPAGEVLLCRSHIRGLGQCNTEVPFEDGKPLETCPRCHQPMPWFGTMEVEGVVVPAQT